MPLALARRIVSERIGDTYHSDGRLTTTRLLTCPRETLIGDFMPTLLDVRDANSISWGMAMHAYIEGGADEAREYAELRFGGPGDTLPAVRLFEGEVGLLHDQGIELAGRIDNVTLDWREIHDYKCHSESAQRFKTNGAPDVTITAQMNIYRLAIEKLVPASGKVEALVAYHGAMTSARGPEPWVPSVQPIIGEGEILGIRPGGGELTVREIIREYQEFEVRRASGVPLRENIAAVRLAGRTMFGRKKCTDYCQSSVRGHCDGMLPDNSDY